MLVCDVVGVAGDLHDFAHFLPFFQRMLFAGGVRNVSVCRVRSAVLRNMFVVVALRSCRSWMLDTFSYVIVCPLSSMMIRAIILLSVWRAAAIRCRLSVRPVGAGSGAPDLITLRGKTFLEQADVIIYAGSLVNPQLLDYAKEGCQIYNSAKMTLEEVLDVMFAAEEEKKMTVRLHTGDPCLYGAIREQLDVLDGCQLFLRSGICPESGIYSSGCVADGDHYQNGRTDTGTGKRRDCQTGIS